MIIAKRSTVLVTNYTWNDCRKLEYRFGIYNRVTHKTEYVGIYWDLDTKTLHLPRGNDLKVINDLLKDKVIIDNSFVKWKEIGEVYMKYLPKNLTQAKTIKFILGLDEYSYTKPYSQLGINLMTGKGKTYVTIAAMAYEQARFIVITSIKSWLQQWVDKTLEYTDFKKNEILQLTASTIARIVDGGMDISRYKMFTCCHASFHRYGKEYGWDKIEILFEKLQVKYKIFDEAHLYFESMTLIDFHSNVYKTLYLTASPYRSGDKENEIYREYFEYVPSIELFDKKKDAVTKYLSLHFNSHPSSVDQATMKNRYGFNKPAYVDYCIHNKNFWKLVYVAFCEAILLNPGRTLILTETNKPMHTIKEWIEFYFPEYKGQIGMFSGETSDYERELAKQQKIVITNRACGGTCLDIQQLGICFPMLVPAKSKVIAHQLFGRVGREGAVLPMFLYIELVDEGFKSLKDYYSHKLPIFMKYATSCNKILYKDLDLDRSFRDHYAERHKPKSVVPPWDFVIPEEESSTIQVTKKDNSPFKFIVD